MAISTRNQKRFSGIRRVAASAVLGLLLTGAAHDAQSAQTDTVWRCWYNQDTRLQCVLRAASDATPDPRYVNNTRLPQTVKQLWTDAASMADKEVFIPLFTEPDDWNRVRLLAESVLCGANRACVVDVSRNFAEAALLDPSIDH